jgi:hypothetical protein
MANEQPPPLITSSRLQAGWSIIEVTQALTAHPVQADQPLGAFPSGVRLRPVRAAVDPPVSRVDVGIKVLPDRLLATSVLTARRLSLES